MAIKSVPQLNQTCVFEIRKIPKSFTLYSLYQGSYKVLECNILRFRFLFAAYKKLMKTVSNRKRGKFLA